MLDAMSKKGDPNMRNIRELDTTEIDYVEGGYAQFIVWGARLILGGLAATLAAGVYGAATE